MAPYLTSLNLNWKKEGGDRLLGILPDAVLGLLWWLNHQWNTENAMCLKKSRKKLFIHIIVTLFNKILQPFRCYTNGKKSLVVLKASGSQESTLSAITSYASSGSVMECKRCGIIYR